MGILFPLYANLFIAEWENYNMQIFFAAGCIVAGIFVGSFSCILFRLTIFKTIRDLSLQFSKLTCEKGDLSVRVYCNSADELGLLSTNFNIFIKTISDRVFIIKEGYTDIASFSNEVQQTCYRVNDNAQSQAASAEEILASIDELSDSVGSNADNARLQFSKIDSLVTNMEILAKNIGNVNQRVKETLNDIDAIQKNAQGKVLDVFAMNLGFSKDVLKDKATIALNVNDVFNSRKRRMQTYVPYTVETYQAMQFRMRQITVSFTYRFNQTKTDKEKPKSKRDENGGDDFQM